MIVASTIVPGLPSALARPDALRSAQRAVRPVRALPADAGTCTPWSRPAPARGPDRCPRTAASPRVVQRLFHRRVRQVEPLLQKINPQHPLQAHRRAPVARPSDRPARSAPTSSAHGTTRSISARNRSRRVDLRYCSMGFLQMSAGDEVWLPFSAAVPVTHHQRRINQLPGFLN